MHNSRTRVITFGSGQEAVLTFGNHLTGKAPSLVRLVLRVGAVHIAGHIDTLGNLTARVVPTGQELTIRTGSRVSTMDNPSSEPAPEPSVFTRVINGELPGRFVWRDDLVVAMLTIAPIRPGHTMVIPIQQVDSWLDVTPETWAHMGTVQQAVGSALMEAFSPARVASAILGLEVPHCHVHLVPINRESDLSFANVDPDVAPESQDATAETIRACLRRLGHGPHVPQVARMSTRTDLKALRAHQVPTWWRDAKLGIFIHWTPAAVPGWAPVDSVIGDLLSAGRPDALGENPYTEWYENSLRFPDSSASRHHRETYGNKPYADFVDEFAAGLESWDPEDWARRFAATGARYVVLVSKHHDGWCLWPSEVANPNRPGWYSERDIVGELREAVLGAGMRFGLYYSGGLDWTFDARPIGNLGDMLAAIPRGDYPAYADAHVRELIARYRPSVLWNDIAWPATAPSLWKLMGHYYESVPDGVLNDRWMPWMAPIAATQLDPVRRAANTLNARATRSGTGLIPPRPPHFDVRTPEYVTFDDVQRDPWECVRGIDHSFGYNRNSGPGDFLGEEELLTMTTDIVSKGGNLLLNVGPRGEDATIPAEQCRALDALGRWSGSEGSSIFGSRPWVRPVGRSMEGHDLRIWAHDRVTYVSVGPADRPRSNAEGTSGTVTIPGVATTPTTLVCDSAGRPLDFRADESTISVEITDSDNRLWPVVELHDCAARPL